MSTSFGRRFFFKEEKKEKKLASKVAVQFQRNGYLTQL